MHGSGRRAQREDTKYLFKKDQVFQDSKAAIFGTGEDIHLEWNGSYLQMGPSSGFWAGCPVMGFGAAHQYAYELYDDFMSLSLSSTANGVWTPGTNTNGTIALGSAATANTPGLGGYVTIGTDGTAQYDYATIKATSSTTGAPFKITENSGKKLWYETKVMPASVTDKFFMLGLMAPDADDITVDATGAENVADGFYFRTLLATETQLDTATNQNTTETEIGGNVGTVAANTALTLGMYFDGVTTLTFYLNGSALDDTVTIGDTGNIPNDVGLTPVFHVKDGVAGGSATSLHIDYVKCVQLR